jgi:hypothetical protein
MRARTVTVTSHRHGRPTDHLETEIWGRVRWARDPATGTTPADGAGESSTTGHAAATTCVNVPRGQRRWFDMANAWKESLYYLYFRLRSLTGLQPSGPTGRARRVTFATKTIVDSARPLRDPGTDSTLKRSLARAQLGTLRLGVGYNSLYLYSG